LVEGLKTPTLHYQGFASRDASGWRAFQDGAHITIQNDDVNLLRLQLVMHVRATKSSETVQLLDQNGNVVGASEIGTQDTQVTLGPFALPTGQSSYSLRLDPAQTTLLGPVIVQPLADFSTSLASE
jgi:hypothetical protein